MSDKAKTKVSILLEPNEAKTWFVATSRDEYGHVASCASADKAKALRVCKARTLDKLGESDDDIEWEVNTLS